MSYSYSDDHESYSTVRSHMSDRSKDSHHSSDYSFSDSNKSHKSSDYYTQVTLRFY